MIAKRNGRPGANYDGDLDPPMATRLRISTYADTNANSRLGQPALNLTLLSHSSIAGQIDAIDLPLMGQPLHSRSSASPCVFSGPLMAEGTPAEEG